MAARKRVAGKSAKPVPARRAPTPRGVDREKPEAPPRARTNAKLDPMAYARNLIRDIEDFPKPGIVFKDITPLIGDPRALHIVVDALAERFIGDRIGAVVAMESRGFIFGAPLALRLNAAFVPVRKPGKLPYQVDRVAYSLEYGEAELEIHEDALARGNRVLIVDDLLATGGTARATAELVARQGGVVVAHAFVVELTFLPGRGVLAPTPVVSLFRY